MGVVKQSVKRMFDRYPHTLKGNRLFHAVQRFRAYRNVKLRPHFTDRMDLLEELDREGIVVLPGYLSPKVAANWAKQIDDVMAKIRAGKLSKFVFPISGLDFCRIAWADTLVPETRGFFADPFIAGLARAYTAPAATSYRHEIDFKGGPLAFQVSELYHFDNWRPSFKAFLYLTDVTERTSPFVYVPRTHHPAPWRTHYDVEFDVHDRGRHGHFFPQEIAHLRKTVTIEDRVCVGPAGTLILVDVRGLHRGSALVEGRRILLNNTFGLMDSPVGTAPQVD